MGIHFTSTQKQTSGGIQNLFEIYNLDLLLKQKDKWPWEKIAHFLSELANTTFPTGRSSYNTRAKTLNLVSGELIEHQGGKIFRFNMAQTLNVGFDDFYCVFESLNILKDLLKKDIHKHFILRNKRFDISTEIKYIGNSEINFSNNNSSLPEKIESGSIDIAILKELYKIVNKTSFAAMKEQRNVWVKYKKFEILSQPYQIYIVDPLTEFAKKLLLLNVRDNAHFAEVMSLNFNSWTSFAQLIKTLFVEFDLAFGDFRRLKVCGYDPCSNMIFEKRMSKKCFCSNNCRKKNYSLDEKYKCRDNQNRWLRDQFYLNEELIAYVPEDDDPENPYSGEKIRAADCMHCVEIVSRGWCHVLREKNLILNNIIPKQTKKIKIRL